MGVRLLLVAITAVMAQYAAADAPPGFFSGDTNGDGCIDAEEFMAEARAQNEYEEIIACVTDVTFDMMGVEKYCPDFFDDEEANHAHWAMVKAAAEECFEDFIHELEERMEAEERERLAAEEAAAAEGAAGEEAPEEEADGEHEEQTDTDTSEEPDMGAMSQLT